MAKVIDVIRMVGRGGLAVVMLASGLAAQEMSVRVTDTPARMTKLTLGSVHARGWLQHQLDLMRTGMTGRLPELSKYLADDNGWFGTGKQGWEEQPYWLRGFYDLAVLTGDPKLLTVAHRWIEAVLASQQPDGYFGPAADKVVTGKNGERIADLWPHMVMIDALISHAEATGDARVVPFLTRFFAWCRALDDGMFVRALGKDFGDWKPTIQYSRAGDMVPHLIWLYQRTHDEWLLDLAARFYRQTEPPTGTWLDNHVINFAQRFGYPGNFYPITKDRALIEQTEFWYALHMTTWGQQPRGIFGADEQIRLSATDPRQGFETCGFGEFAKNNYALGRITGNPVYADRTEDLLLNHFPAAQTPDLKALHYLTASNQPQLDNSGRHEYFNKGRMISYSPHIYRCCQHNVAMTWPWFTENLWQGTADRGLVAWMYSASEVTAKAGEKGGEVTIREGTDYPFRGAVKLTVAKGEGRFPIYLRVPRWARGYTVAVNGRAVRAGARPSSFVRIERNWRAGDVVAIEMAMQTSLTRWPRTGAVTVDRGPLSYSVKIAERWRRCGGTDAWPEWEVLPASAWNYGLVLDGRPMEAKARGAVAEQPWTVEATPVEIRVQAKKILKWKLENETVGELQPGPVRSSEPVETITLIPLGCARLRMSVLPVIGEGREARVWREATPK
jgi:hypothetical protein